MSNAPLPPAPADTGRVVTLGMFIIDQFEHRKPDGSVDTDATHEEQIGGGGTYAIIGARVFLSPIHVGMIVDIGLDFPDHMRQTLRSYGDAIWHWRDRPDGTTTRALNIYSGEERGHGHQSFKYLTPRMRISTNQLPSTTLCGPDPSSPIPPSYLHFVCSPLRALEITDEAIALNWPTYFVYEPIPPDCNPSELENLKQVAKRMRVLSPNHIEALTLLSLPTTGPPASHIPLIEIATRTLASFLTPGLGTAIVRSGPLGVCWCRAGSDVVGWVPAVFGEEEQGKVRDVTGGGNAFLGGLCAGLLRTGGDDEEAILCGSVAASFAIEQDGLPPLEVRLSDGAEIWSHSGESAEERLARFRRRVTQLKKAEGATPAA